LLAHLQAYVYFQYLVNLEIDKLLANLEEIGLLDDTVIVFTSDHGEMGGAHGGQIEKWHNAYRETLHVPLVVSSPLVNPSPDIMVDIDKVTSHIDLLPTLLGLAGYDKADQAALQPLILGHEVYPLPGRDLSGLISGDDSDQADDAEGVLFVTQDDITLPTDRSSLPATFTNYLKIVDEAIAQGKQNTTPGPIAQPNHVYAYCEQGWKLVRYIDGRRSEGGSPDPAAYEPDQWELYDLVQDPAETVNLVSWQQGEPVPEPQRIPAGWQLDESQLVATLERLRLKLASEMARVGYGPDGGPAKRPQQNALEWFSRHDFNSP
jgi:arylsulfatase A-like enzyme